MLLQNALNSMVVPETNATLQAGERLQNLGAVWGKATLEDRLISYIFEAIYVDMADSRSIAERIGLVPGDIITDLNLRHVANASDLEHAIANLNDGSHFSLSFIRGNKIMTCEGIF